MRTFIFSLLVVFFVVVSPTAHSQPDAARPLSTKVQMYHGRPTLFVNDQPHYPMIYALTDVPGGRWSWEEVAQHNISNFCEAGVHLFQVDLFLDHIWHEDERFDITPAQKQIAGILEVCPQAAVMIRFHVTAPKWWTRTHPGEWVEYADTDYQDESTDGFPRIIEEDNYPVRRVSMASKLWREESGAKLSEFLTALARTPEGNALGGMQIANGVYGEWHNWGFYRNEPDVSKRMTQAFREWLRSRYGSDSALRTAWHRPGVSIATAEVPGMNERRTQSGIFRDPTRERNVIDYYTCVHELVADNIIHFARIVKHTWPRPIVTGTFYGYYFSTFGRQAAGGHLELHRVLESPFIDYLSGPQAYEPESMKLGEPYRSRSLITSIRLNGKLWLDEMDVEPTLPNTRDTRYDVLLRNSIANVRRNILFSYTKGMGLWFYDFGVAGVDLDGFHYHHRGSRGNWDHPTVMTDIKRLKGLLDKRLSSDYRTEADVLFVYDTRSLYHTASLRGADPVTPAVIDFATLNAFKSGVVFDPVHIDDLAKIDFTPYRVVVFGNTFLLTDTQRDFVRTTIARGNRTLVWFYAPGYSDGTTLNTSRISALTGITVEPVTLSQPPEIVFDLPPDSAVTYRVGEQSFGPLFAVSDPGSDAFGHYKGTEKVAIARKSFPDHTSWYIGLPNTGTEPMRHILGSSGAHVYSASGDVIYAGAGILAVHAKDGGTHVISLNNGKRMSFELPEGATTLVLDSENGEILLPIPQ
ncbi:MAG: hypothetical protein OEM41_01700 [Ignavibacteria bacterium]|nr:hypothetical protein [Ignavibacteria bacterium]